MSKIFGKLLRINLSNQVFNEEQVSEKIVSQYLGGRSLGAWLLYHELDSGIDPFSESNKLIFMTGPLVGTIFPSCNRYIVLTKSPQTGLYLMSISGGNFGTSLRRSGYDIVVIEGESEKPVIVSIVDGDAKLLPAEHLWGLNTSDCEGELKKTTDNNNRAGYLTIGPAGENKVVYAGIFSNKRAAGRGGAGAIMGAKKVKAIIATGHREVGIVNNDAFKHYAKVAYDEIKANNLTSEVLPKLGSAMNVNITNELGIMPHFNWMKTAMPDAKKISGEYLRENHLVRDNACSKPCIVKCAKIYKAKSDHYKSYESDGPDYETLYSLGSACGIYDPDFIIAADSLCDELGIDTISTGLSIAFMMECYEKGIIKNSDTGGYDLTFGNAGPLLDLIRDIAEKKGFGKFIAMGTKKMSEELGEGTAFFAMHAKGMELGAYDPRGIYSQALVYACGSRGGCHHAGGFPLFAELSGNKDLFTYEGKADLVKATRDRRIAFSDSPIVCNFTAIGVQDETLVKLISAVTGYDLTVEWFFSLGDRASTIERAFNVREGIRRKDDILPQRILAESIPEGPTKGNTVELERMLDEFYNICGWDIDTGIPNSYKLEEAKVKL